MLERNQKKLNRFRNVFAGVPLERSVADDCRVL